MHFAFLAMHIEISSDMPQIMYFGSSHTYLTVGQANLTVERGFSHCKQCREVERSASQHVTGKGSSIEQTSYLNNGCPELLCQNELT